MKKPDTKPDQFIAPLNMNKLQGRMLYLPTKGGKKRNILLVYGHHTTLEQCWQLAQELAKYGSITIPDLPGFGGMESMYKLGERPSLNRLADYVASFVKLRYKKRRLVIAGVGFGFLVATRMLQRYPDLAKRVDFVISLGGFAHYDDFNFDNKRRLHYRRLAYAYGSWLSAPVFRRTTLPTQMLHDMYSNNPKNEKLRALGAQIAPGAKIDESVNWDNSDLRTHMMTLAGMLGVDNCKTQIDLAVWHVPLASQGYIDQHMVNQHLQVAFKKFHAVPPPAKTRGKKGHSKAASGILPIALRRTLANTKSV